ncbi:MAG TPA: exodeoxyribonuclease VII large subunit [Anaerovoracaceae bacterium]|nr:exodeoxyribonuclease VII large subunit [Anaerovoracaceae bacterium]
MAIKPVSVTQFNNYVKRVLQSDPLLGNVSVIGEVSNLKYHGSGHVFFTLKDEGSRLSCFLPYETAEKIRYVLTEGMLITASGYISVYDRGGTYSLNIRDISIDGTGNLALAFDALKKKLEKQGIFDPEHKKPIPKFPKRIVIITSETGAAVRDIIKIIRQRNDVVDITLYPCLVQGQDAASDIALAIESTNVKFPDTDTIIVGRGGGSMEELWAFNEEIVVRSIFLSKIPVISAVGHETDFTLSDYVSDKRAATPTEAAQIAVPDIRELRNSVSFTAQEIFSKTEQYLNFLEMKIEKQNVEGLREQILGRIEINQLKSHSLAKDILHTFQNRLTENVTKMDLLYFELQAASPYSIMERGYGALLDEQGKLLTSLQKLKTGDLLTIIHRDGRIISSVEDIKEAPYGKKDS